MHPKCSVATCCGWLSDQRAEVQNISSTTKRYIGQNSFVAMGVFSLEGGTHYILSLKLTLTNQSSIIEKPMFQWMCYESLSLTFPRARLVCSDLYMEQRRKIRGQRKMESKREAMRMKLPQKTVEEKNASKLLPFVFFINNNDQNL